MTPTPCVRPTQIAFRVSSVSTSSSVFGKSLQKSRSASVEALGHVGHHAADAGDAGGEPRAGQDLLKVVDLLALAGTPTGTA